MRIFIYWIIIFGFAFGKNRSGIHEHKLFHRPENGRVHGPLSRPVLTIHKIESLPKNGIFHFKDALQNTPYIMELVSEPLK